MWIYNLLYKNKNNKLSKFILNIYKKSKKNKTK